MTVKSCLIVMKYMVSRKEVYIMIPIPTYLSQYATEPTQKRNRFSFKLKCTCGCEKFSILNNAYTDDEKQEIKEYEDKSPNIGLHSLNGEIDSNGNPFYYIKIFGIFKKRIEIPEEPICMRVTVVKAVCSKCLKEILLFDNRYHGYDAVNTVSDEEAKKYIPHFKQKNKESYNVEIIVENESSLEKFMELLGEQCSFELYADSFSWIEIVGVDSKGKKKVFCDYETA